MNALFRLLGSLPLFVLHLLGALLGLLVWLFAPGYRQHLAANLRTALGRPPRIKELFSAIVEPGKASLETAWVWTRSQDQLARAVRSTSGWDKVEAAHAAGHGIVLVTPHLGCFEIAAQYYSMRGGPITVLFRRPRKTILAPLMDAGRNRGQMRAVAADSTGVRVLLKALRAGESIGILPDQVPKTGEGVWAPFFGRPAYTMTLAAKIAGCGGSASFVVFTRRLPWGRGFHFNVEPLELPDAPLPERVAALNAALERQILTCPSQYLWGYDRYKTPAGVPGPDTESH